MRLRREPTPSWSTETRYTVLTDGGRNLGTVHSATSSRARHVSNTGGVRRWIATTPEGEVVSPTNTYTRRDAIDALERHHEGRAS